MTTPTYTTTTHVYKTAGSLDLTLDVSTPVGLDSSKPLTALIFYHAGFLVCGSPVVREAS